MVHGLRPFYYAPPAPFNPSHAFEPSKAYEPSYAPFSHGESYDSHEEDHPSEEIDLIRGSDNLPTAGEENAEEQDSDHSPILQAGRFSLDGVQFNSAPNELQGPGGYIARSSLDDGSQLFADMFSRADQNDDGGLTFEEFKAFFGDNILTAEDLVQLFNNMDLSASGNIDLSELVEYFAEGYEPFSDLFSSLARIHQALSGCLQHSYEAYPHEEAFERFRTRVFLSECQRQITSLQTPVKDALRTLRDAALQERGENIPLSVLRLVHGEDYDDSSAELSTETERLSEEVDKLSRFVDSLLNTRGYFQFAEQGGFEVIDAVEDDCFVVVSRMMEVQPEMNLPFRDATRSYIERVKTEQGNQHVYVRKEVNQNAFTIYEIWEDESYLAAHNQTVQFRQYQKEMIDCLESPAVVRSMQLPVSWWA